MSNHGHAGGQGHGGGGHHFILPMEKGIKVWIGLLILTVVTVASARVDLGMLNFPLAMVIATIKALLVILFFMGLKYDNNENRMIFATSFLFLAIFVVLTSTDLLFRGPGAMVKKGDVFFKPVAGGPSKFESPWVSSPKILAHGKTLFDQQCAVCHGGGGKGDGAAGMAMTPKPRNFTAGDGWSNGRKPSQVFGTLTSGLRAMPAFASMPMEDRWALAHYVLSLGPAAPTDTPADLAKVGVDPSKKGGGISTEVALPIDFAIERMSD